ncbi:entry exclusion protein TrbK [Agrobacterium sp. P15N1-A]|uniref:entry exclusion protein TrbK n=1 Tax=Agrobacterium sp. P15N1-A TaxID=3342820 RepID=UPI0037CE8CD2
MSARFLIGLLIAGIVAFGGTLTLLVFVNPQTNMDGTWAARGSDVETNRHHDRFFGGDPDRDVRGGQEMKPRW